MGMREPCLGRAGLTPLRFYRILRERCPIQQFPILPAEGGSGGSKMCLNAIRGHKNVFKVRFLGLKLYVLELE